MIRLNITVEGATELAFVKKVLAPHLASFGVYAQARPVLTSKDRRTNREYRGGMPPYPRVRRDIATWMKEDRKDECWFSTMFDLYGLSSDFPEYEGARQKEDPYEKVAVLEKSMDEDISHRRFIPYLQVHEFEALVLVDPSALANDYLEESNSIVDLCAMVTQAGGEPERINDGSETAPSKRILRALPSYDKVYSGPRAAESIGIPVLGERCPHFGAWLKKLEDLAVSA
jgi:hypothetical protein